MRALSPQPGIEAAPIKPTSELELETFFRELQEGAQMFAKLDWTARAALARECLKSLLAVHQDVAAACGVHKGTAETGLGEELLAFAGTFSALRQYAESLEREGRPALRGFRQMSGDRSAVRAFPSSLYEHLLFPGWCGEVWVKNNSDGRPSQGSVIRQRLEDRCTPVCVQLAAGNQASVITCDIIEKMFGQGCVCLVKLNPVNEYLGPVLEQGFAPLIDKKLLRFTYGPASVASQCINHPAMDELHMTGSDRTYNMIQWGYPRGPTAEQHTPKVTRSFTAELGACTPYIVCPGQWSERQLREWARSIVSMKVHNAGCNCVAPQILVTSKSWAQRDRFLDLIREEFSRVQTRKPWYPGAADRLRKLIAENPGVECFPASAATQDATRLLLNGNDDFCPWLFLPDAPSSPAPAFFRDEFFAGALAEVALESSPSSGEEFLQRAVDFVNDSLWGTLSCALLVPPSISQKVVEQAVENLKYGSVNVNTVTAAGYFLSPCTWGAHDGHIPGDIQSGTGVVHNTLLLDSVVKSVMWAPWEQLPYTPFWFYSHANAENLGLHVGKFFANGTFCEFVKTAFSGIRG